jgi:hypothetical protein
VTEQAHQHGPVRRPIASVRLIPFIGRAAAAGAIQILDEPFNGRRLDVH